MTRAVMSLIKALGDDDDPVRWGAAEALGEIGDASAVVPLIEAMGHNLGDVRKSATEALRKLGHEVE